MSSPVSLGRHAELQEREEIENSSVVAEHQTWVLRTVLIFNAPSSRSLLENFLMEFNLSCCPRPEGFFRW